MSYLNDKLILETGCEEPRAIDLCIALRRLFRDYDLPWEAQRLEVPGMDGERWSVEIVRRGRAL